MNWSPSSIKALPGRFAAQREIEDLAVEFESLLDIADFKGDMVDADEPRLLRVGLAGLGHAGSFLLVRALRTDYIY